MALILREIFRSPVFQAGLLIRLVLIVFFTSKVQDQWFVPFLDHFYNYPSFNPWNTFINSGGDIMAFPYGPVMLVWHLPLLFVKYILSHAGITFSTVLLLRFSLFFADFSLLLLLIRLFENTRLTLYFYWMSPIAIYISYWHGQNDVIPVFLLLVSLYCLKSSRISLSGLFFGLAVSAKLSMILAFPVVFLYFLLNNKIRQNTLKLTFSIIAVVLFLQGAYSFSADYIQMVYGNPESQKIYYFSAALSEHLNIYIIPVLYILTLYVLWRTGKFNFDLLLNSVGVVFFIVIILTPASPGWYFWILPFLVYHQIVSDVTGRLITFFFSSVLVLEKTIYSEGASMSVFDKTLQNFLPDFLYSPHIQNLSSTAVVAFGIILVIRMTREGIFHNDFYRLSKKPFALGLSGSDELIDFIKRMVLFPLFQPNSLGWMNEKNYNRGSKNTSNGNLRNYDFFQAVRDFEKLTGSGATRVRYSIQEILTKYLGKDLVVVEGESLCESHALSNKIDQNAYFRTYPLHKSSIQLKKDFDEFVKSRKDIIVEFTSVNPMRKITLQNIQDSSGSVKLRIFLRNCEYYDKLMQALIGVCAMKVDMPVFDDEMNLLLIVEGELHGEDIKMAAKMIIPYLEDITGPDSRWNDNSTGIIQLLLLTQLTHARQRRASL